MSVLYSGPRRNDVAHSADIQVDRKTLNDILSAFKRTEAALHRRDIDGIMELYSDSYTYQSFNKLTLRKVWADLFQENHDFSTTHVFTKIKLEADNTPHTAQIVCTGSLWAIQMRPTNASTSTVGSERSITWFPRMVHGVYVVMPGKSSRKRNRVLHDLRILFFERLCELRQVRECCLPTLNHKGFQTVACLSHGQSLLPELVPLA